MVVSPASWSALQGQGGGSADWAAAGWVREPVTKGQNPEAGRGGGEKGARNGERVRGLQTEVRTRFLRRQRAAFRIVISQL